MVIKVLGSGCKNCVTLKENTETALKEAGIESEIETKALSCHPDITDAEYYCIWKFF
ncbi:MAG: thioredoxin family protein [Clostridia bacterium]|nr:thioredoxin family protein [Clostridia bacterium]